MLFRMLVWVCSALRGEENKLYKTLYCTLIFVHDLCITEIWVNWRNISWFYISFLWISLRGNQGCFSLHSQPHLGGVYLLQLWMWSRLPVARPMVRAPRDLFLVQHARLQPTWTYMWDQVIVPHARMERAYKEYTDELDRLMTSSVSINYYTWWIQ
jgi:hypothetical protein